MAKDKNPEVFPEETKLKLAIFAECFKEWLPVFIHDIYTKGVFIIDFFAGDGMDAEGNLGSPLLLLKEAKGENCEYCNAVRKNGKRISFAFNEIDKQKQEKLIGNVNSFMSKCNQANCTNQDCVYSFSNFGQYDFKDVF